MKVMHFVIWLTAMYAAVAAENEMSKDDSEKLLRIMGLTNTQFNASFSGTWKVASSSVYSDKLNDELNMALTVPVSKGIYDPAYYDIEAEPYGYMTWKVDGKTVTWSSNSGNSKVSLGSGYHVVTWINNKSARKELHSITIGPTKMRLSFNCNGGSVVGPFDWSGSDCYIVPGQRLGTLPELVKAGCSFVGWYDGSVQVDADSKMKRNELTLWAKWSHVYMWFDATGGTISAEDYTAKERVKRVMKPGDTIGKMPVPKMSGVDFLGWYSSRQGGTKIDEEYIVGENDTTFYAHWNKTGHVISLDANGGIVDVESVVRMSGSRFGELPIPTREGYFFSGWFVSPNQSAPVTPNSIVDADVTLYAHWSHSSEYMIIDLSSGPEYGYFPVEYKDAIPSGGWTAEYKTSKMVFRRIPAGRFEMGSPETELGRMGAATRETLVDVSISPDFYVSIFEITLGQWLNIMGSDGVYHSQAELRSPIARSYDLLRGKSKGAQFPKKVSVDADSFLGVFRNRCGSGDLDLLTEAQWEYACRAGTTSALNNGMDLTAIVDECANLQEVGWAKGNADGVKEVGLLTPNSWGLYDMHGNVGEWCRDWATSSDQKRKGGVNPLGADYSSNKYSNRVVRGGWWLSNPQECRSASSTGFSVWQSAGIRLMCAGQVSAPGSFKVKLDANGGSLIADSITVETGKTYGELPTPIRIGYEFLGWFTSASGGTRQYSSSIVAASGILYAQWKYVPKWPTSYRTSFTSSDLQPTEKDGVYYDPVVMDPGGASGVQRLYEGLTSGSCSAPACPYSREGYSFAGWNFYSCCVVGDSDFFCKGINCGNLVGLCQPGDEIDICGVSALVATWKLGPFTVTLNANGGSCSTKVISVDRDSTYGTLPTPTRTGYSFDGWYTASSGGTRVTASSTVVRNSAHTLYAHWTALSYTVTFNANGGSCSTASKSVTYGSTYGSLPTPTKVGMEFAGWFTAASGGTQIFASTTVALTSNQTLYARWTVPTYTVTFNANGGSCSESSRRCEQGSSCGSLPTPTRTGYGFLGWFTASSGGTQISATTTVTGNMTVYAHWEANSYSVAYDPNSGSGSMAKTETRYDETVSLTSTTFTRAGYRFVGWSTTRDGSVLYANGGNARNLTATKNATVTLYAIWKPAGIKVNYFRQRYPWNGLVDLEIVVTGDSWASYPTTIQAVDGDETALTVRTIGIGTPQSNGNPVTLTNGTNHVVWDASADLGDGYKCDSVRMRAVLVTGAAK